jgi:hypothetical protein
MELRIYLIRKWRCRRGVQNMILRTIILILIFIARICGSAFLVSLGIIISKELIKDYLEITMNEKITIYSVTRALLYVLLITGIWLILMILLYAIVVFM